METNIKTIQFYAKQTKILKYKLKHGIFFNKENQFFVDDLLDESKLTENKINNKKPRIGKNYQVDIMNEKQ